MSGARDRSSRQLAVMGRREVMVAAGAAVLGAAVGLPALATSRSPVSEEDMQEAQRYQRERQFVQTRFGRIAYVDRGRGAAVLLLHGFPLSSVQWRAVIPRLCANRRCLAPDFMGLGFTECDPAPARRIQGRGSRRAARAGAGTAGFHRFRRDTRPSAGG